MPPKYLVLILSLTSLTLGQAQTAGSKYDEAAAALMQQTPTSLIDAIALREKFVNWPTPAVPYMNCNPKTLSINSAVSYKYPVSCQLASAPASTVTIFLEAYGMKFSTCYMQFNPSNWATPQTFDVLPSLDLFATQIAQANPIYMLAFTKTEAYNNQTFVLPVSQTSRKPVSCSIAGDPHINPFDMDPAQMAVSGVKDYSGIDYQGTGDFTIVESTAGLRILGAYAPCNGGLVTCITGIQVQYNKVTYIISYNQLPDVAASTITQSNIGTDTSGTNIVNAADLKSTIITLEDGSSIAVNLASSGGNPGATPPVAAFNYINTIVILSPIHYQKVGGHCHYWDDTQDTSKFVCRTETWPRYNSDGTVNQNNAVSWGDCWKTMQYGTAATLSGTDSVLSTIPQMCQIPPLVEIVEAPPCPPVVTTTTAIITTITTTTTTTTTTSTTAYTSSSTTTIFTATSSTSTSSTTTAITPPQAVSATTTSIANPGYKSLLKTTDLQTTQPAVSTTTQQVPTVTPKPEQETQPPAPCSITPAQAQLQCQNSITQVPGCENLISISLYINNCVSDVLASCALDFCTSYRTSYLRACGQKAGLLVHHPNATMAVLAVHVQVSIGQTVSRPSANINVQVDVRVTVCAPGRGGLNCDYVYDPQALTGPGLYSTVSGSTAPLAKDSSEAGLGSAGYDDAGASNGAGSSASGSTGIGGGSNLASSQSAQATFAPVPTSSTGVGSGIGLGTSAGGSASGFSNTLAAKSSGSSIAGVSVIVSAFFWMLL